MRTPRRNSRSEGKGKAYDTRAYQRQDDDEERDLVSPGVLFVLSPQFQQLSRPLACDLNGPVGRSRNEKVTNVDNARFVVVSRHSRDTALVVLRGGCPCPHRPGDNDTVR